MSYQAMKRHEGEKMYFWMEDDNLKGCMLNASIIWYSGKGKIKATVRNPLSPGFWGGN